MGEIYTWSNRCVMLTMSYRIKTNHKKGHFLAVHVLFNWRTFTLGSTDVIRTKLAKLKTNQLFNKLSLKGFRVGNIAKGTTDPRVEFLLTKVTSLGHITSPYTNLQKFHLQNLDQAATQKSQPNSISIKLKLQNLDQI